MAEGASKVLSGTSERMRTNIERAVMTMKTIMIVIMIINNYYYNDYD